MITELLNNTKRKTILIVDDEPIVRELCASALYTHNTLLAADGEEALRTLANIEVDLILSDVVMPHTGGLELLSKVRSLRPDLGFILMTGYSDKELILEALKEGADDFINKPINILQLSTTVNKALEKQEIREELAALKRTDKLKNDFLGLISHKLKTPATAISLFIENIASGIESPDDENFQQMVAMVQAETLHLEQLIQDLLYFSEATLEDDNCTLEAINLRQIAEQVAAALEPIAASNGIDYHINVSDIPDQPLMLNSQRVNFAIRALLDNAIKFTPDGGTVSLTGEITGNWVKLQIKDTGIGIPKQELVKIFNKFYQVDPEHTGQVRGFGLGLFYARDFIRSMSGQLSLSSEPQQGTTATVEFPLEPIAP